MEQHPMKAVAARPIDAKKHLWYTYNGSKKITLRDKSGGVVVLSKGDLFGVQNLSDRVDRVVTPSRPDLRFLISVEVVSDLIDMSKRHRLEVAFADIPKPQKLVKPKKIRVTIAPPINPQTKKKADRISIIKKAAKNAKVQSPVKVKKKRESFDLDEDTFSDDYNFDGEF
jgi:hypothetical protein